MLKVASHERKNIALICQVDLDSAETFNYHVVLAIGNGFRQQKQFAEDDSWLEKGIKLCNLTEFYAAAKTLARTWNEEPAFCFWHPLHSQWRGA
jgi:hypothetical protein